MANESFYWHDETERPWWIMCCYIRLGQSNRYWKKIDLLIIHKPNLTSSHFKPEAFGWLCWGLTSQSTIFQSCRDEAIASWVINQYFRGVKCHAQGHNTAEVGLEPRTSRSDTLPLSHRAPQTRGPWATTLTWMYSYEGYIQPKYCKCCMQERITCKHTPIVFVFPFV